MNDNLFKGNLRQRSGARFLLYFPILLVFSLIGVFFSSFFMFSGNTGVKIAQGLSSILMFVAPPIAYFYVTRKEHQMQAMGFRKVDKPWPLFILIGIMVMFISLPVTNQLTTWNEGMKLPDVFKPIEDMLKVLEQTATDATERMLNVDTIGGLLFNLVVLALIPAIGEEMTFRGTLQQALTRGMKSPHPAIILTAAIFSFIHFQFYGFLPRMFLGILLGYMFYITKSLWTSITMHFVNNGTAVVLYYLNNKGIIEIDPETFGSTQYPWLTTISFVVTAALIGWCWWKAENDAKKLND